MTEEELVDGNWSHTNENGTLSTIFLLTWIANQHEKIPVKIIASPALVFS